MQLRLTGNTEMEQKPSSAQGEAQEHTNQQNIPKKPPNNCKNKLLTTTFKPEEFPSSSRLSGTSYCPFPVEATIRLHLHVKAF